jgi:glycosyltransferase involved in cell wall biosynthesis
MFIDKAVREGAAPAAGRPEKRLSVCFVAPHIWPVFSGDPRIELVGGAEVQQATIARLLAADGFRVSMVTLDYGQPDAVVLDGIAVHKAFAPHAGLPLLRFLHPRMSSMLRAMRAADADVYYYRSASMWAGVMAEFARRHGRRSIYAGASDRDFAPGTGGQIRYARDRWLFRHALRSVDSVVVQNLQQQAACRALTGREAIHIPSCYALPAGASPRREHDADGPVLWVGTIQTHKRPELLLELARRLPRRRFVMIGGEMPGHAELYQRIRAAAAGVPNVEFKGFLPLAEVERWFDRARVHVTTSRFEGMPNVCLQAWARGVPTVGTLDVGARLDGEQVYPAFDDLDAFASHLDRLLQNEDDWGRASNRCREYFERTHSPAEVRSRYASLLRELVR